MKSNSLVSKVALCLMQYKRAFWHMRYAKFQGQNMISLLGVGIYSLIWHSAGLPLTAFMFFIYLFFSANLICFGKFQIKYVWSLSTTKHVILRQLLQYSIFRYISEFYMELHSSIALSFEMMKQNIKQLCNI